MPPRKGGASDPALAIDFFTSGFYPYRSQLYAPFKNIGINVIQFHDPVIDGANMENTDLLEWSRRPGFSKFCPTQLGTNEIVNQFYSSRNLTGIVTAFFDSNTRLASFTSTGISTILNKTTAAQGYISTIGNMTYISDGAAVDMQKWDVRENLSAWGLAAPTTTPTIANIGCWLPETGFALNSAILDPNGNVEVVTALLGPTGGSSSPSTASSLALAGSSGGAWAPTGDYYSVTPNNPGYSEYLAFTGFGFAIPAGATILGVVATIQKYAADGNVENDQSVRLVVGGTVIGSDKAQSADWNTMGFTTATYGSPTDLWGTSLTVAQINNFGFGVAVAANIVSGSNPVAPQVGFSTPNAPTITVYYKHPSGPGISGLNEPVWSITVSAVTNDAGIQWTNYGNIATWLPVSYYPTPAVVLDPNGNLQLATTANNPIATAFDPSQSYVAGDLVSFGGLVWTAMQSSTGVVPSLNGANSSASTTGGITTTIVTPYWAQATSPLQTGTTAPVWNTDVGGTTSDGDYTWVNIGQGGLVESFGTSYVYGFRTIYGHLTTCSPVSLNTGSIFGPVSSTITSWSITSDVVTFQGANNFIPGNTFTVNGLTAGSFMNGQTFVVLATGLSATQFEANFTNGDVGSTSDAGSTLNLIATVSAPGTDSPLCNASVAITATQSLADIVTIYAANTFVPGLYVTFSGLTVATFLNGLQLQIINVDPVGQWFQVYFVSSAQPQTADTGTATFNAVEFYRVSDGGGTYLFAGAVTNPGASTATVFNDFTPDVDLNELLIAPQNNLNDPPPGAPGSSISTAGTVTAYWQGRLWMAVGNYVYFDAGPDCINGIPEESWPPANRFQYAGPVFGMKPTADGVGLLVYLADRVCAILGGPETISFYSTDALDNFGISNPNALFKDGSILGQFTTQGQYFELIETTKEELGQHVADYLAANFNPATTYATMHRNGNDVGVFLSNGSNQVLRYGTNVPSWSVPYFPVGGAGALRSIETSVGAFSLMLASPNGGGYLLARDLTTWLDNEQNYTDCFITIGSIQMSQPGAPLFPLQHVVGYFDAVGTLNNGGPSSPSIWILPNEINGNSGIGFIQLPEVVQEPPIGQTNPSTTLLQLRWPVNMMNSALASQYVHHLQVKIQFEPENAPNTLKSLALKSEQD